MTIATKTNESRCDLTDLAAASDTDLLDAWTRDGHRAALAAIIERYNVMVLSVCWRRCRSEADADDAFQTTFLYLARNAKKIRHPERLAGWLHRVAQRSALATLKAKKHETESMVDTPANPDDPLDRLAQRHEAIVLDEELADLPEHYRAALVMHIYEGEPLVKLADHFGTTVGSIRGRLQRGKELLGRRLRRRGVIPVTAFAAASAWTVDMSVAAEASQSLMAATSSGDLPEPPIEPSLVDSLLNQGANVMSSLYTMTGLVGGTALLALLLTTTPGDGGENAKRGMTATIPAATARKSVAQFSSGTDQATESTGEKGNKKKRNAQRGNVVALPQQPPTKWVTKPVTQEPTSAVAAIAEESLDKKFEFSVSTSFVEFPDQLAETIGVPILVDDRAIAFAEVEPSTDVVFNRSEIPLRTALRQMLAPLGLKAVVEDEGIVITADPNVLVHRGIGISRWVNIDNDAEKSIAEALDGQFSGDYIELPLAELLPQLREEYELQIVLDDRSLEDIGLTTDLPITFSAANIKIRSALQLMLQPHDLTYTIQGESLVVTSIDENDSTVLNRIYWLEGTGFADGDYDSITEMIMSTIEPDYWAEVGGSSTIAPLSFSRPALIIGTTYTTHQSIEQLLSSLRESHFGSDPILKSVEVPATPIPVGEMGGGGMGGGLGGGMF